MKQRNKKMKNSTIKRIIILILAIALIIGSVFIIRSCNAPPEYSEIEARFKELMKNSQDVNVILFGDGLSLYPKIYETSHTFTDKEGNKYYYYTIDDESLGTVYRYRRTENLFYYGSDAKLEDKEHVYLDENGTYYYEIEDYDQGDRKATLSETPFKDGENEYFYYTIEDETYEKVYKYNKATVNYYVASDEKKSGEEAIYEDSENGLYYYRIPLYVEPEFYYTSSDPENYGYVRDDAKCTTVAQIKTLAEKVYSKSYLRSLYELLFDGFEAVPARYSENSSNGRLMQYENYESLFNESCVYMFETAEIDTWQSNSTLVRIKIKAYLPSAPDKKYDLVIDLAYENENWYLESPTYIANLE